DQHPLAFLSQTLGPRLRTLSTYEKESLAVLMAVERWRSYLQTSEFVIRTDHRSLSCLDEQRLTTPWQQKALTKLLGLNYRIEYRKGALNQAADALSRRPEAAVCAISVCVPRWLEDVKRSYTQDPQCTKILAAASVPTATNGSFQVHGGLIRYKGRVWIGNNPVVQQQVLAELHSGAIGGHSGVQATYSRLKQHFAWPQMKQTVKAYVAACAICKQAKPEHVKYPGLLQPLPVPKQAWEMVTLDFVEGLPTSKGFNSILVVVDKLTRYAHFIPLRHPFSSLQVAKAYMDNVFKLHGPPDAMVSDCDRIFTSKIWQELCKLAHITLNISSARHPQTDGTTERVNQCMELYLRCFVHNCPNVL
uniref:Integrase catalytic domain-containing protein n=1 Tax=Aegilops tauschii subsp. strangulata TaxID=200361 RepID=A0A453QLK2_AEGTS